MSGLPLQPARDEFLRLAASGATLIPVRAEIIADAESPVSAFRKLSGEGYSFLLESAEQTDQVGRYSFVGSDPELVFQASGRRITLREADGGERSYEVEGDPLAELERLMAGYRTPPGEPSPWFRGGAVGYLSYDMVRHFEPSVPEPPPDDMGLPDMVFLLAGSVLIFDHRLRRLQVVVNARVGEGIDPAAAYGRAAARVAEILARLDAPVALPRLHTAAEPSEAEIGCNTEREDFLRMVRDAQEYIRAGDIFQVVLAQRFETPYAGDPLQLYRALRFVNPSPYMFLLRFGPGFSLVGSSPEVHVRVMGGKVEIRPIAGTRRRGETPEEDERNAAELLADPKERAEHIMLVDLARNDVGRIAEFESVKVTDLMTIEKYSHVMHIVSNVVGTLRGDRTACDVMRATFPAGTVSGSPKVRAMQIINALEKNRRGPYAGAVAILGFDGNMDSCITLRTVALAGGRAFVQAGAGIVADSTPEGEYQETVNKAMGMMRAIAIARGI